MTVRRTLKAVHFLGTLCFMASVAYIIILALRQANVSWWIIFSLSMHTLLFALLLVSLYLFVMFRGIGGSPIAEEHPLTSSGYYMLLYVSFPFIGMAATLFGMFSVADIQRLLLGVSLGTFGGTFLGWVIIDPLVGFIETLMPASHRHRTERFEKIRAEKQQNEILNRQLLEKVLSEDKKCRDDWEQELSGYYDELVSIIIDGRTDQYAREFAAGVGVKAWRLGGLGCMKFLHASIMEISHKKSEGSEFQIVDTISPFWDGIGRWQTPSMV